MRGIEALIAAVRDEGGLLAGALASHPEEDPLADAHTVERALVLAAVREGYLLHYGEGNVVRTADADLALLGGDRLYALGVARLVEEGDLDAVAVLADLISRCAQAHAEDDAAAAAAAWRAATSTLAVGPGG
jgi:hypothetical protein